MNHVTAYKLLTDELDAYRALEFEALHQLAGERTTRNLRGDDGVEYSLNVWVSRHPGARGEMAVRASIGEAKWGHPHDALDERIVIVKPSVQQ